MGALQWAVLILSVAIVIAVVIVSRKDRRPSQRWEAPPPPPKPSEPQEAVERGGLGDQMDIFQRPPEVAPVRTPPPAPAKPVLAPEPEAAEPELAEGDEPLQDEDEEPSEPPGLIPPGPFARPEQFDEFGVGKPRRRIAPSMDYDLPPTGPAPVAPAGDKLPEAEPFAPAFLRVPSSQKPAPQPAAPQKTERREPNLGASTAASVPPPAPKIISLLIAAREGSPILGPKLHQALRAQGLRYGHKQVYHRLAGDKTVFSVASLVKPGVLIPEEAAGFVTPGLSVFAVLPGPQRPTTALQDMLSTAQTLARALDAEVYTGKKQLLTNEVARELQNEVEEWARASKL